MSRPAKRRVLHQRPLAFPATALSPQPSQGAPPTPLGPRHPHELESPTPVLERTAEPHAVVLNAVAWRVRPAQKSNHNGRFRCADRDCRSFLNEVAAHHQRIHSRTEESPNGGGGRAEDRKSTRLNSSHITSSYAGF